ncbi:MAG: hypothetical protein ABJH19_18110, partial [Roseibium sp.]
MSSEAGFTISDEGEGHGTLALSGPWLVSSIGAMERDLARIEGPVARIDLSDVSEIDTVGAWVACDLAERLEAEVVGASDRATRLMEAVCDLGGGTKLAAPRDAVWTRIAASTGDKVYGARAGIYGVLGFLGAIMFASATLIRHPGQFRGKALVRQMELVGVAALPIVGLMSFLIGIVIAQQGAV